MKTKLEILDIVANHYNSKNRAVDAEGACQYMTNDGRTCAVGMCMRKPETYMDINDGVDYFLNNNYSIDHVLKSDFHGHGFYFWQRLQDFHDIEDNWDEYGLTEEGKKHYNKIKEEYQ